MSNQSLLIKTTFSDQEKSLLDRFSKHILVTNTCWIWLGAKSSGGYGHFTLNGKTIAAHRFSFEISLGPIKKNLCIDHLCAHPYCVNPDHLEDVTIGENTRRGNAGIPTGKKQRAKKFCPQNHPYSLENTWYSKEGWRICRICHNESSRISHSHKRMLN